LFTFVYRRTPYHKFRKARKPELKEKDFVAHYFFAFGEKKKYVRPISKYKAHISKYVRHIFGHLKTRMNKGFAKPSECRPKQSA